MECFTVNRQDRLAPSAVPSAAPSATPSTAPSTAPGAAPSAAGTSPAVPPVTAIVMASGLSSRMGTDKLLLTLNHKPVYSYVIDTCAQVKQAGLLEEVLYVSNTAKALAAARAAGLIGIANPTRELGKSQSIVRGVRAAKPGHALMFLVADQPLLSPLTLELLIRTYWQHADKIVAPQFAGKRGNPVIFPPAAREGLAQLTGDQGGNVLMRDFEVLEVPMVDAWEGFDVDTREQFEAIREHIEDTSVTPFDLRDAPGPVIKQAHEAHATLLSPASALPCTGPLVVIRGAGDLATGVIQPLVRAGFRVLALELPKPLTIRRTVAASEAVYEGVMYVEDLRCQRADKVGEFEEAWAHGGCAVAIDPKATWIDALEPAVVIDATLAKRNIGTNRSMAPVTIALGPGYEAGVDVDIVIETSRGHDLGRLIFTGPALPNTGIPGNIAGYTRDRVVHSPASGIMKNVVEIGAVVKVGQVLAYVGDTPVLSKLDGLVRGLLRDGLDVTRGLKVGDVDPRGATVNYLTISDKARALGGATLQAVLLGMRMKGVQG